jgi:selenocysteine lyase/cysteine desulfurase
LWQARERFAQFLGGDPKRLVFTANVSVAMNIAITTSGVKSVSGTARS